MNNLYSRIKRLEDQQPKESIIMILATPCRSIQEKAQQKFREGKQDKFEEIDFDTSNKIRLFEYKHE